MKIRPCEPSFCTSKHLKAEELEIKLAQYTAQSTGRLSLIVQRKKDGSRSCPSEIEVSVEGGVHGDRWFMDPKRKAEEQIAVMDTGVARLFANTQSLTLFGDNLFIHQDWSLWKAGEYFTLGTAVFRVTEEPHTGCAKFAMRFGHAALKKTVEYKAKKLRGIYVCVERGGTIKIGDCLKKLPSYKE